MAEVTVKYKRVKEQVSVIDWRGKEFLGVRLGEDSRSIVSKEGKGEPAVLEVTVVG